MPSIVVLLEQMRQSQLFTKTAREDPRGEVALNAKLLIRAGFVAKEMAGVYVFLPLGLRVLNKIVQIIREEMNAVGGQEIWLSALQDPEAWQATDRWSDEVVDIWFKAKLKSGAEVGLAPTHEEPLTRLMRRFIHSWRDLPVYVYQFQTKFRNELRAKSGLLRGREFLMKDLYSFNADQAGLDKFYQQVKQAYFRIFQRVGLGDLTYLTFASGGSFTKYSHEFQTLCSAGEDEIYLDEEKKIAVNKEVYTDEVLKDLGLKKERLKKVKAAEVGNIFKLGTRFSEALGLYYLDKSGRRRPVIMGSYGIGVPRLMATIVETFHDGAGIIWPEAVSPFKYHLLVQQECKIAQRQAEKLYRQLQEKGVEVLLDDRPESLPVKLKDADLIGCPTRVVVSRAARRAGGVEVKSRTAKKPQILSLDAFLKRALS